MGVSSCYVILLFLSYDTSSQTTWLRLNVDLYETHKRDVNKFVLHQKRRVAWYVLDKKLNKRCCGNYMVYLLIYFMSLCVHIPIIGKKYNVSLASYPYFMKLLLIQTCIFIFETNNFFRLCCTFLGIQETKTYKISETNLTLDNKNIGIELVL